MSETVHEFNTGPYELLNFETIVDEGKAVIELNGGDLGRLPIEDLETIEEMREALDKVEAELKEQNRRAEEL